MTMRRLIAFGAVAGLAALVLAQVRGTDLLANFAKALNGAKSVSSTYTVQRVGDTATTYKVDLAKPNKARIDTPTQLIVADGTTITTYDKGDKTYYKKPETDADLKAIFASNDLGLFGAFFDADYYKNVVAAKAAGQKNRKGVTYDVVENSMDAAGKLKVSLYLDPSDKLAKIAEINMVDKDAKVNDTLLVMTKELSVNGAPAASLFAFSAPDGSREISLEEMNAGKWYDNMAEAQAMSKKLNKPILVDFYADW